MAGRLRCVCVWRKLMRPKNGKPSVRDPGRRSPSWCFASRSVWPRRGVIVMCRIPDDCIDSKRYPLFMARAVLKELIESLQSTQGVKPC